MKEITRGELELLACKHHAYGCGKAVDEAVLSDHCFDAVTLVAFVGAIEAITRQNALIECRRLCTSPQTLFDDGYNAALSDFEETLK